ncbi:MAG: T9SS type A sorting domain-containing protein [Paludibacteraceae bacterium]|nr:T9SS type A sorting domain-containing protein [Paludibacteraceae bacterium]
MKKVLLVFAMVVASFAIFAQGKTKIYINPGHGGWDSDDRYVALPPYGKVESKYDTLAFWESSSNLDKGLILYHMLDSLNQIPGEDGWEFMISRTLNRTEDDRLLSEIVEESNAFNSNFMLSIHSNAGNPANYPLMLYSGVDEGDDLNAYSHKVTEVNNAESRAVSKLIGDNIRGVTLVPWTNAMQLRGDKTFARDIMGWSNGYGVLRDLTTPGLISEGRMHDYAPETYRLMNHEYRWLEAWHFLHAFVHYYKGRTLKTGNIAGDVRDKYISVDEFEAYKSAKLGGKGKYYRPGTRDAMMPLCGADVALMQNGDTLRTYKTDQYFNGFWLFGNLNAGTYQVAISKEGYHTQIQDVVVNADETTYVTVDMQAVRNTPPEVISFMPANNEIDSVECGTQIIIDWNWSMEREITENAIKIEPAIEGTFTWENYGTRLVFTPTHPFIGNTVYTITIATTAAHPDTGYTNTLQEEYVSKFLTKSYDTLKLLATSPAEGEETTLKPTILLLFDSKLSSSKDGEYIYLVDEKGNILEKPARTQEWNKAGNYGTYKFEVTENLVVGKSYKLVIDEFTQNRDGITIREKREIPFTPVNMTEPLLTKVLDCSTAAFTYNEATSSEVSKVKVAVDSKEVLFEKSNKLTYTFNKDVEEAYVEYSLKEGIEVNNGVDLAIPMKGDFSHNNLQLVYVNEDATDSVVTDFVVLNSLNWKFYNVKVADLPEDGKKWYLSAFAVEKTGHPANAMDGIIYIENIYWGSYGNTVNVDQVVGDGVSVWPNPATDFVYVSAPENAMIEVYSVDGTLITSMPIVNETSENNIIRQIATHNLNAGVYVVNITTSNSTQTLKFIKE